MSLFTLDVYSAWRENLRYREDVEDESSSKLVALELSVDDEFRNDETSVNESLHDPSVCAPSLPALHDDALFFLN